MSRGNPPDLPSLKNPEWLKNLITAFPNDLVAHVKFVEQHLAQVEYERRARDANPIAMAPAGATEPQQYEHYRRMIETRGFKLDPDTPTVLAMRGISREDGQAHRTEVESRYGDTFVVLTRDSNGDPHVRVLAGSTHPGNQAGEVGGSIGVPDVATRDGITGADGHADVGIIVEGEYDLVPRAEHVGAPAWDVRLGGSGVLPGFRDTNQDDLFSDTERAASEARNDTLTGVMIHQGGRHNPWSLGCINVGSGEYSRFVEAIGGENQGGKLIVLDGPNVWDP